MRRHYAIGHVWSAIALTALLVMAAPAPASAQQITVSPPLTIATQTSFTVDLDIDTGALAVQGVEVVMSYDPGIVQLDGIDAGDWFTDSGLPYFLHDFTPDVAPGVLHFDAALLGGVFSGTGTLAVCHFTALAPGDSPLDFVQLVVRDGDNASLAFTHSTGDLIRVPASQLYFDPSHSFPVTPVFTVDLVIDASDVQVKGAEVEVSFDPAIVAIDAITPGAWVTSQGLQTYFYDYSAPGSTTVHFAMSFLDGTATGSGVLAVCQFSAVDVGTSPLDFMTVDVRDGANQTLPFQHSTGDDITVDQAIPTRTTSFGSIKALFAE